MIRTFILALCFILAILLMLYAAVALVQDKSLFGSAPKGIYKTAFTGAAQKASASVVTIVPS
jgi:hypothetical protein